MSSPELQKNILAPIAYYDGMDYPLTAFEVWKYLINCNTQHATRNTQLFSFANIIKEIDDYNIKRFIGEDRGLQKRLGCADSSKKRENLDGQDAGNDICPTSGQAPA